MATLKQLELGLKRTTDKIAKLSEELAELKESKVKQAAEIKAAKATAPKAAPKKKTAKKK